MAPPIELRADASKNFKLHNFVKPWLRKIYQNENKNYFGFWLSSKICSGNFFKYF